MQLLTVLKSFRLSMVYRHGPERMDCYAFLKERMEVDQQLYK